MGRRARNEGTSSTVQDSSIYENDGVITNAGWYDDSLRGNALSFDGTTNRSVTIASDDLDLVFHNK